MALLGGNRSGGSATAFHCSYHVGELLQLTCLLFAFGTHFIDQSCVGAVAIDSGGDGGKIAAQYATKVLRNR